MTATVTTGPDTSRMLQRAGLRATKQREAIVRAIAASERPETAQALHAKLAGKRRGGGRGPGLATVYRTLQSLAQAKLARAFPAGEGELAYKLCEPEHHHHLVCERCGLVVEIPSCEVEEWAGQVAQRRGFKVSSHQADIYGLCESCARISGERARG